MSVEHLDTDQMILLTPASSFGLPDMASIETPVPAGQPVVTIQVPIQASTNISVNVTYPLIDGTNQGARGCHTCHEWVLFWWEGQAGCNLGPAWTECRLITLVVHQDRGVLLLKIQWLSFWDELIEFDTAVDVEWVIKSYSGWNGGWGPCVT